MTDDLQLTDLSTPIITWIDVARILGQLDPTSDKWKQRPENMVRANVDWLSATFSFDKAPPVREVLSWLSSIFPNRISAETEQNAYIVLDGPEQSSRLPIEFEQVSRSDSLPKLPLGAVDGLIDFRAAPQEMSFNDQGIPLVAFHSVKGGNGRTTAAIACSLEWSRLSGKPTLLVDADLEAPGLSYLYNRDRGPAQISFEDLLAIAHSDMSAGRERTIQYTSDRLLGQETENLFVLPVRRDLSEITTSSIRSEHLSGDIEATVIAHILRCVARTIGCHQIVVDLRAGLVPISALFLLDPTIDHVFVTSLSSQSLESTAAFLKYAIRESRRRGTVFRNPLLIVNRIPTILRETGADNTLIDPFLEKVTESLVDTRVMTYGPDQAIYDPDKDLSPLSIAKIAEISDLQVGSSSLQGFITQIRNSGFASRLAAQFEEWLQVTDLSIVRTPNEAFTGISGQNDLSLDERCRRLQAFSAEMVAAEVTSSPIDTPLVTGPLRSLAEQFTTQLPIVVSEGSKGTGKTLTARFLAAKKNWGAAVETLSGRATISSAPILPVLGSIQASESFQTEIDDRRRSISNDFGFGAPQRVNATVSYLQETLQRADTQPRRVSIWQNAIAWAVGFKVEDDTAGADLIKHLRSEKKSLLAVIEGIEELYADAFADQAPLWLRSLLVDLPQALRSEPQRPLGTIIFARRDSVDAAVPQNSDQFRRLYQSFALTWSEEDVLELSAWLATRSGALTIWDPAFQRLSQADKEQKLYALWGRKLGPDDRAGKRTAEAYSANWIVAVLSDLQSRLVARDLVRFLENAAAASIGAGDAEYVGRLLTPKAIRQAVKPTSIAKVNETQEEIKELRPVFEKFSTQIDPVVAPLETSSLEVLGLTEGDIRLLQRQGIIFGESAPYEVPELFRMGLNLKHSGARRSVINLRRRARQRLGLPV